MLKLFHKKKIKDCPHEDLILKGINPTPLGKIGEFICNECGEPVIIPNIKVEIITSSNP